MFDTVQNSSQDSITRKWWPDVSDLGGALAATRYGSLVALVVGGVSVLNGWATVGVWSIAYAALFAAGAFGLYRASRVAAVATLLLFLVDRGVVFFGTRQTGGMLALVVAAGLGHAVRGTFAYHRLSQLPNDVSKESH